MSAGTLVGRPGPGFEKQAHSSRPVPGSAARCQDLGTAFILLQATEWLYVPPHRTISVTKKASGEDLMVHLYLFLGYNSAKQGI